MIDITITEHKGITQNNYLRGFNINLDVMPSGVKVDKGSSTPLFRFLNTVKL